MQTAVDSLRDSAAERTSDLQKEMATAQDFTSSVKGQWVVYMEQTEKHYVEDTAAVESGRCSMEEGFRDWYIFCFFRILSLLQQFSLNSL